jgi:NAD(P)-dependent dehydrogenase (short-subunit alcohol dehydrogenase family)
MMRGAGGTGSSLFDGRVVAVAGKLPGIADATVSALATAGAAVAIIDSDPERSEESARALRASGGTAVAIPADLEDETACRNAIARVTRELGAIDGLVNLAGGMQRYAKRRPIQDWTTDTWDSIFHLNVRAAFWLCRAAIPFMTARRQGSIVNVASIAAAFGTPKQCAYGAARAALVQFTKTIALECGHSGIRANAVSPAVVLTHETDAVMPESTRRAVSGMTPLGRLADPDEIAQAVLFFASPMASFVTGQVLLVDGGISVRFPFSGSDPSGYVWDHAD